MKIIRLFVIIVLICLVLGLGEAFDGKNYKSIDVVGEETSDVEPNVSFSDSEEEKNFDVSTKTVDKTSTTSSVSNYVDNHNDEKEVEQIIVPNSENIEQKIEFKETEDNIVVDSKQPAIKEKNVSKETPKITDETKEEVDNELERLQRQIEYESYDECMSVGFDEAIKNPVGILGFSCPYIAYKGKIIGYRLQLDYTNPMEN